MTHIFTTIFTLNAREAARIIRTASLFLGGYLLLVVIFRSRQALDRFAQHRQPADEFQYFGSFGGFIVRCESGNNLIQQADTRLNQTVPVYTPLLEDRPMFRPKNRLG